jgi:hypothetical protein
MSEISEIARRLAIPGAKPGQPATLPCVEICLFDDRPRAALAADYAGLLAAFIAEFADGLNWYKTNTMKRAKAIGEAATAQAQALLLSPEFEADGLIGLEQHSGPDADTYETPSWKLFSEQVDYPGEGRFNRTFLRLCLPLEAADDPEPVFALMRACADSTEFHCGHAGLSWYWNTGDTLMEARMASNVGVLLRHPCVGYSDPLSFQPFIGDGLIQTGWLTLLGPKLVEQAGGTQALRSRLDASVSISDLASKHGLILRAGESPMPCSNDPANAHELIPYSSVGRATNPVRIPDEELEFVEVMGLDEEDDARTWYLRFFEADAS